MNSENTRRDFLRTSAIIGTGLLLNSCKKANPSDQGNERSEVTSKEEENKGGEVTATEDLMR